METTARNSRKKWWICAIGLPVLLVAGYLLSDVLNPFLLAALLGYMFAPVIDRIERFGIRRWLAVFLLYIVGGAVLTVVLLIAIPPLIGQGVALTEKLLAQTVPPEEWEKPDWPEAEREEKLLEGSPLTEEGFRAVPDARPEDLDEEETVEDWMSRIAQWFRSRPALMETIKQLEQSAEGRWGELTAQLYSGGKEFVAWGVGRLSATIRGIMTLVSYGILVPLYLFFFLQKWPDLMRSGRLWVPSEYEEKTLRIFSRIDRAMSAFFRGRLLVCVIKGTVAAVGLWILGVEFSFLLGLFSGILSIVPVAGFVGGAGAATLVSLQGEWSVSLIVWILVVFSLAEGAEAIANPVVFGRETNIHPVMLVFGFVFFAKLFGFFGILLAVPLISTTKILWEELLRPYLREEKAS